MVRLPLGRPPCYIGDGYGFHHVHKFVLGGGACRLRLLFLHFRPATQALWASGDSNPGACPSFFQGGWSWIFKKKQKGGIPKKLPLRYGTRRAIRTPDPFGTTPPPHARGGTTPLVSISDGDLGSPSPPLLLFRMHCPSILRGCSSDVSYNAPSSWRNGHGGGRTLRSLFPLPRHS